MKSLIAQQIMTKILFGEEVEAAYGDTIRDIIEFLDRIEPQDRADAVRDLGISDQSDIDNLVNALDRLPRDIRHVIVPGGGVADVPDAMCVALKLNGNSNPTRDDVEKAFRECLEGR
ncbi:MAG: hypothetical protein GY789_00185 [Hyphomicrobiales bacterium]|nr:hypothetical protein [Hyphomicrobiales bacterium]MCP4998113.1 hypothetical protein [Hyphomicrobiales bacterium]